MEIHTLYRRDARGNILKWQIQTIINGNIEIAHGIIGGVIHREVIQTARKKVDEVKSRITAKRKEGYKALEDVYDNAPRMIDNNEDLIDYLKLYLPKYSTTSEGFVLPMLAKTLEDNKPFEKIGTMLGQWKINGLRCIIGAEKIENDLFNNYRFTYTSREGTRWNLSWMDDILSEYIDSDLIDLMIKEGACLDGELYLPGYSVNDINSFVKNPSMPQHKLLQYWCYDICCENMTAFARYEYRLRHINRGVATFITYDEHLHNKEQLILLPSYNVEGITNAIDTRNRFIDLGFEGLILRNPNAEYQYGKRNSAMFKFKKKEDGLFEIVNIKEDKRGLPIYTLKNDINSEYFECTINLPQEQQRAQLLMKSVLIGKKGLVEYRERSGIKQVPFHAKLIKIFV